MISKCGVNVKLYAADHVKGRKVLANYCNRDRQSDTDCVLQTSDWW